MPVPGTKLRPPPPRPSLVERARLTNPFTGSSLPRLVLVAASAGFGKTTLLSQWLTAPDLRGAWVSLDDGDADVHRFLTSCVGAVQTTDETTGAEARALLEGDQRIPAEDILAALLGDLDRLPGRTVLALDDYHRADSPDVHAALAFLLENLPPQVCVALATRTDPPVPLARLRSRGELVEVRSADLRFTPAEAAELLQDVMNVPLEAGHVDALEERTEGWVAGLQLAGLSARTRAGAELGRFVEEFTGSHRFVLDYLVEEVLDGLDQATRAFLLHTSVLDQLTGPLCDAVTGLSGGQRALEELERGNVFVVPLDDHRQWYRYHHLFADALQARLRADDPDRVEALHRAASVWHAGQGMLDDAVRYAARTSDVALRAELVELAIPDLRRERRTRTIIEWLEALPERTLRERPLLAMTTAWARLAHGDVDGASDWLDTAEQGGRDGQDAAGPRVGVPERLSTAGEDEARNLPAMVAVYRAAIAQARGDAESVVAHARRAQGLATASHHMVHGAAAGFLALAAWASGDVAAAKTAFTGAVEHLVADGGRTDRLGGTVVLGELAVARGRPAEARRLYETAIADAEADPGAGRRVLGDLHVGLAVILVEQNEQADAQRHLDTAVELGDSASFPENRFRRPLAQARLLAAAGAWEDALEALDAAERAYLPGFFPELQPLHATRARLWLRSGRVDEARAWTAGRGAAVADATYRSEYVRLTLARVALADPGIAQGRGLDRAALLQGVVESSRAAERTGSLVEALLLLAVARDGDGDAAGAHRALEEALVLAVPAGYRRLFLDEGPPVETLLRGYLRDAPPGPASRAAAVLLAAGDRVSGSPPRILRSGEQLSERELEVTALLATELTGPEIAARLYVSINTLRTHTKHIFTKLDVKTRRGAVARARELGLI